MAEIKFCGMTRKEDVLEAVALGVAYVGVIFAGGPRDISQDTAARILADVRAPTRRVAVFADQDVETIAEAVRVLELDVVQLHTRATGDRVRAIRERAGAHVWAVVCLSGTVLPLEDELRDRLDSADGLMIDARKPGSAAGSLGGTGVALPWRELAGPLGSWRARLPLILAGGLRPENVGDAIAALSPDVVDVSSGIESAPGVKNHERMRSFVGAVRSASRPGRTSAGSRV
ncbi:MAG TPA: phosphoribosylanthranilate isomerase [Gemmatimonadaceae bacterium]|nr:phosphoribosylanthranilate isomerase [Gemmatimonadaceae bacterium]